MPLTQRLSQLPYWLLAMIMLALLALWGIASNGDYTTIFTAISKGVGTTLFVSGIAFLCALLLGLLVAIARVSRFRILREIATFYIELIRGIPMLVLLFYIAFVGAPFIISTANSLFAPLIERELMSSFSVREFDFVWRAILALTIGYSAFIAEVIRAGIEAVGQGQREAAAALGLTRWQTMRLVILPQAFRTVLPPLGNDFVSMIKDSALVSVLGVQDITQLGKVYSASTFMFFETYNVVALLYLFMTVSLSLLIRFVENKMKRPFER